MATNCQVECTGMEKSLERLIRDKRSIETGAGDIKKRNAKRDKVREIAWGKAVGVFQGKDAESEVKVRCVSKIK